MAPTQLCPSLPIHVTQRDALEPIAGRGMAAACRLLSPTSQLFSFKTDRDTSRDSRPIRLIYVAMQLGCVVGTAGMFALDDVNRLFSERA